MKKATYLLFFSLFLSSNYIIAQTINTNIPEDIIIVKGKITDRNGIPLIGAVISSKGTSIKTTTNFDGIFSLEVEFGAIISISFDGFITNDVIVKPNTKINFVLNEKPNALDLNSNQVATHFSRKELRKLRRERKYQHKDTSVENLLLGMVEFIAKNH